MGASHFQRLHAKFVRLSSRFLLCLFEFGTGRGWGLRQLQAQIPFFASKVEANVVGSAFLERRNLL